MSTNGVLSQIARGPWIEFVARNAACLALERADDDDDDEEGGGGDHLVNGTADDANEAEERRQQRLKAKEKELQKQRLTGLGKSIDSEAFKAAVERGEQSILSITLLGTYHYVPLSVLAQNKLNAPRI